MFDGIQYYHYQPAQGLTVKGRLVITNYKIILGTPEDYEVISTPLSSISALSFAKEPLRQVEVMCKEALRFVLSFPEAHYDPFRVLMDRVFPLHPNQLFAPLYYEALTYLDEDNGVSTNGWHLYKPVAEWTRMKLEDYRWRISRINATFQLCETYPKRLVVPVQLSDGELLMGAQMRLGRRIPVLTWRHRNGSFLCHGTSLISRSSQQAKSDEGLPSSQDDNKLLTALIRNSCSTDDGQVTPRGSSSPSLTLPAHKNKSFRRRIGSSTRSSHAKKGSVSDIGPPEGDMFVLEIVCDGQSAGRALQETLESTEVTMHQETLWVCPLSELRESYRRVQKLCVANTANAGEAHWLTQLESTQWMSHLRTILLHAQRVVNIMSRGGSVLLCDTEEDFDRSCQISALAQLWMDPYYRTVRGFAILIEKEWLGFGHPFQTRSGLLDHQDGPGVLPVFVQFLDAVWQSVQQYPQQFEFIHRLLVELAVEVWSARYGTFCYDHDRERRNTFARSNTASFWTHVTTEPRYRNPLYQAPARDESTLHVSTDARVLTLWAGYFLRWYQNEEMASLPRLSTGASGLDILSTVYHYTPAHTAFERFQHPTDDLQAAERYLLQQIQLETERLQLMKEEDSLRQVNQLILQHKQKQDALSTEEVKLLVD